MLKAENLKVAYGDIEALHGVSFNIEKGELVSVIGANGAGKTTILRALMGLTPLVSGSVSFKNEEIGAMPPNKRAGQGIRIVPERARVFPQMTVRENLLMGAYRLPKDQSFLNTMKELYEIFPVLEERKDQTASTLSGGEQQQLAISRALISKPELLLVDEVSMGLMPKLAQQVLAVLKKINEEQGLTILLVEQNANASLAISSRAYVLETGEITLHGTPQELSSDARIREAYLGL